MAYYKHGGSYTKLFRVWCSMKERCTTKSHRNFSNYGGRGISVCSDWFNSFPKFKKWAECNGYSEGLQIDRIDNNGNYKPGNCRFTTIKENTRNSRGTKLNIEAVKVIKYFLNQEGVNITKLAKLHGVSTRAIYDIKSGKNWPDVKI